MVQQRATLQRPPLNRWSPITMVIVCYHGYNLLLLLRSSPWLLQLLVVTMIQVTVIC